MAIFWLPFMRTVYDNFTKFLYISADLGRRSGKKNEFLISHQIFFWFYVSITYRKKSITFWLPLYVHSLRWFYQIAVQICSFSSWKLQKKWILSSWSIKLLLKSLLASLHCSFAKILKRFARASRGNRPELFIFICFNTPTWRLHWPRLQLPSRSHFGVSGQATVRAHEFG